MGAYAHSVSFSLGRTRLALRRHTGPVRSLAGLHLEASSADAVSSRCFSAIEG
jgi:hypothetical protein